MSLKVVNILGEPGSGKSTTTANVFGKLSIKGFKTELVQEAAKDFIWEASYTEEGKMIAPYILSDQIYLFAEQNRRIERLREQREYAIVECPLLMSLVYQREEYYGSFENLVLDVYNSYLNINILLERNHNYDKVGRIQNETETAELRKAIINVLNKYNIPYKVFKTSPTVDVEITDYIESLRKA